MIYELTGTQMRPGDEATLEARAAALQASRSAPGCRAMDSRNETMGDMTSRSLGHHLLIEQFLDRGSIIAEF